jgi:hypothetical protein
MSRSFKKGLLFFMVNPFGFLTNAHKQLLTGDRADGKVLKGDNTGAFTRLTYALMAPQGVRSTVNMF